MAKTNGPGLPYPLLKWAGGKRGILQQLQGLMPADVAPGFDGRLVEPFVGGAAVFFYLKPKQAVLADLNEELINFYKVVRDDTDSFLSVADELSCRPYDADHYYEIRGWEPTSEPERAARLLLLNKWGWNGLYRVNRKGKFNVPFGRSGSGGKPELYELANVRAAAELLRRAELIVAPFEETLSLVESDDFVYMDPPYHPISATSTFTSYTQLAFGLDDQRRLRDAILEVEKRTHGGARLMLSNSLAPDLVELYERQNNLRLHTAVVTAFRSISSKASTRGGIPELVVTNY